MSDHQPAPYQFSTPTWGEFVNKSKPNYVYVASSWRNPVQGAVVEVLRAAKIDCYDFKNPEHAKGFKWREVMPSAVYVGGHVAQDSVPADDYVKALQHPRALEGFMHDFNAMQRADTCILVLPCNRSAHLELGWFVGQGRRTAILLDDPVTPELMYRMVNFVTTNVRDLLGWLGVED